MTEAYPMARRTYIRLLQLKELTDICNQQPDATVIVPVQNGWSWEIAEAPKEIALEPAMHFDSVWYATPTVSMSVSLMISIYTNALLHLRCKFG
jgi:hypothetical protein